MPRIEICGYEKSRPTRFPLLGYRNDGPGLWRIVDRDGEHAVGPFYKTKAELLADLDRYAKEYGDDVALVGDLPGGAL